MAHTFKAKLDGVSNSSGTYDEQTVDVPAAFAKAMNKSRRKAYDSMSYSHRKEYVQWIEAAKKMETRVRRIALACTKLDERAAKKP